MFPIECPTKLSLMLLRFPDLEYLSIFFFTKDTTSFASLSPISLKSPDVFSSLTSDIKNSTLGSINSHWFRTSRKSRWCPCKFYVNLIKSNNLELNMNCQRALQTLNPLTCLFIWQYKRTSITCNNPKNQEATVDVNSLMESRSKRSIF